MPLCVSSNHIREVTSRPSKSSCGLHRTLFSSSNISIIPKKSENSFIARARAGRKFRDESLRARHGECIFFHRRELLAFFASMAGVQLYSNEFFSAGTRAQRN